MFKIFTAIYVICSIYSSNPGIGAETPVQCMVADNPMEIVQLLEKEPDKKAALKQLGFYRNETGNIGLKDRNAVLRFQSAHNMTVNGNWDKHCTDILKARLTDPGFKYTDTVSEPPSDSLWITINKTKRILTLYKNETVEAKYPIAVGKPSALTPDGKFTIVSRVKDPTWGGGGYAKPVKGGSPSNPLGYRWLGLSPNGGNRYGIHGNSSPYSIGKDISHGCIRMINFDVEELFERIETSTPVWIGSEKQLNDWGVFQAEYSR